MADKAGEDNVITNSDKNVKITSKEEKLPASTKYNHPKATSGGRMPPVIDWTKSMNSSAGSSDTMSTPPNPRDKNWNTPPKVKK